MRRSSLVEIEWNDGLSVGIMVIDEQHKMWIQRFNAIVRAIETDRGVNEIVKTLNFLLEYTNFHFFTEEELMTEKKYPKWDYHKKEHEKLKLTLNQLVEDFQEDGATQALAESINVFLANWLVKHIQKVDLEFGRFLIEKGFSLNN